MASTATRRAFLAICLVVAVAAEQQPVTRRDQRQLFSASGLVFPGPAMNRRRIHEQPAQAQAQVAPKTDQQGEDAPFLAQGRPQNRQNRPQQSYPQQFRNGPPQNFRPNQQQYPQQRQPVQVPVYNQERPRPAQPLESRQDQLKQAERIVPPAPVSLGQRPEEFVAPRAPVRPQPQPQPQSQSEVDEEEDRLINSAEEEQFVPQRPRQQPPQPQQPQPVRPPVAPEARRPNIDVEPRRPQPSVPQPQQPAKRPNYPANYKARPQPNEIEESRRPQLEAEPEEDGEQPELLEEEEEVKPDKLQLLLQKTDFNCAEKKDGYYADEAVDCQVFHYCQDRTRHSWLCPEGASFHQVHLICMPINKENICQKSSEFHFVNDYLYKNVEDENGDSTLLYADRYYPEGYEPGLPFDMEKAKKPENQQFKTFLKGPQPPANRERQPLYAPNRPANDNRRQDSRVPLPRRPLPAQVDQEDEAPVAPRRPEPNQRPAPRPVPARPVEAEEESEEVDY